MRLLPRPEFDTEDTTVDVNNLMVGLGFEFNDTNDAWERTFRFESISELMLQVTIEDKVNVVLVPCGGPPGAENDDPSTYPELTLDTLGELVDMVLAPTTKGKAWSHLFAGPGAFTLRE